MEKELRSRSSFARTAAICRISAPQRWPLPYAGLGAHVLVVKRSPFGWAWALVSSLENT